MTDIPLSKIIEDLGLRLFSENTFSRSFDCEHCKCFGNHYVVKKNTVFAVSKIRNVNLTGRHRFERTAV